MSLFRLLNLSLLGRAYLSESMQIPGVKRGVSSQMYANGNKSMAINCRSLSVSASSPMFSDVVQSGDFVNRVRRVGFSTTHGTVVTARSCCQCRLCFLYPICILSPPSVRRHHVADNGVDVREQHQGWTSRTRSSFDVSLDT